VQLVERERNFGLARSIIDGVSQVLGSHGRVIVVEDDLLLSPHFLRYMNDGLALYADNERVASIHGYRYPARSRCRRRSSCAAPTAGAGPRGPAPGGTSSRTGPCCWRGCASAG
jgi:hypothetical protein